MLTKKYQINQIMVKRTNSNRLEIVKYFPISGFPSLWSKKTQRDSRKTNKIMFEYKHTNGYIKYLTVLFRHYDLQ